jgi:hypothetical protein
MQGSARSLLSTAKTARVQWRRLWQPHRKAPKADVMDKRAVSGALADTHSRFMPNTFQLPNVYIDVLLPLLTSEEWRVLCYLARRIFGFDKDSDRVSLSQFEKGIVTRTGTRLDSGCGLGHTAISRALAGLIYFGLVLELEPANRQTNTAALYGLQLEPAQMDMQGLHDRKTAGQNKAQQRTAQARLTIAKS